MNPASDAGRVHSAAFLSKDTLLWLWAPLPWCIHEHRRTVTATRQVMACKLWWISIQSRNQQYCWSRHGTETAVKPWNLWSSVISPASVIINIGTDFNLFSYTSLLCSKFQIDIFLEWGAPLSILPLRFVAPCQRGFPAFDHDTVGITPQ